MAGMKKIKSSLSRYALLSSLYQTLKRGRQTVRRRTLSFHQTSQARRLRSYHAYVLNQQLDSRDFVPLATEPFCGEPVKKIIAFYLPQYYQIQQNDAWFGRGFTEWTNTTRAVPQFAGHWQPHLPIDVGYYSLDTTQPMYRQIELAKTYGIHGFCFYYYWFSGGARLMEKPLLNWLDDRGLDLPFMLFWANEDWTNTWGSPGDLGTKTYSARMAPSDADSFVRDIVPFFRDPRYITVDGRPHLIIYQAKKDPFLPQFIARVADLVEQQGLAPPYVSLVFPDDRAREFDPRALGADAAVEFGPHLHRRPAKVSGVRTDLKLMNPLAKLTEYDMKGFIENGEFLYDLDFPVFKGAMTHFDNTARKIYTGAWTFDTSPRLYQQWLSQLIRHSPLDQVFVAAWNEWAEGMHLEPDQRYGYAYLHATRSALEENAGPALRAARHDRW